MRDWWKQLWCDHSWVHHWLHLPDRGMELKICTKCNKSEIIKIVKKIK